MPNNLSLHDQKLFENLLSEAASRLSDTLLESCADLEYRVCLLELGINI